MSVQEFRKYWAFVKPNSSDDELFDMFEKARFGQYCNMDGKVEFVRDVLRRYKAMEGPVRLSCMRVSCMSLLKGKYSCLQTV